MIPTIPPIIATVRDRPGFELTEADEGLSVLGNKDEMFADDTS
jgi:hypothetical protein